jgi:phage gpG-like protein
MPAPNVSVEGLDLVIRNLRNMDRQLPRELSKIHKEVAEPVADRAKRNVNSRTGRLARSIRPGGSQKAATVTAGATLRPYNYARINHWGGYPGAYPGNPFLTDALHAEQQRTIKRYDRALYAFVEKVWVDS